jgi:uncharacterized Fe-S cluster-containing radical SAM superfamily protein
MDDLPTDMPHRGTAAPPCAADVFADVQNVFIELTSRCNMRCRFCPHPVLKREKKDMPHEHVLKILEELKGCKKDVTFHCVGEPLLNGHFLTYAALCDANDINYWLVTNGLAFTPAILDKLFSLKRLQLVEISFHTLTEESFALRGCTTSFANYLDTIHDAVFCRERLESGIKITIDVMYDMHLYHEELWKSFSFDAWRHFTRLMAAWGEELHALYPQARLRWPKYYEGRKKIFWKDDHYTFRRLDDIPANLFDALPPQIAFLRWEFFPNVFVALKKFFFFTKNPDYLRHAFGKDGIGVKPAEGFDCGWPCHLVVLSNGAITFCCLDYEGDLADGNIESMTLAEAAQSSRRRFVLSRPDAFPLCQACKGKLILPPPAKSGER